MGGPVVVMTLPSLPMTRRPFEDSRSLTRHGQRSERARIDSGTGVVTGSGPAVPSTRARLQP
jgi:hypothetical protein